MPGIWHTGVVLSTVNGTKVAIVGVTIHKQSVDQLWIPFLPSWQAWCFGQSTDIIIPGQCCRYMYTPSLISVRFVSLFFNFLSPVKLSCHGSYTPALYECCMSIWFGGWAARMEGGYGFMPPVCDKSQSICQFHYLLKHKGCSCYYSFFNRLPSLLFRAN